MINDTIKNNKDSATIILFSFLNPTIPKGMATNANELFLGRASARMNQFLF
jgi:hypothetical protein